MSKDAQIVPGNIKGVVKYVINVESAMEVYIMITYVQQHNLQFRNNPFWNKYNLPPLGVLSNVFSVFA